MSWDVEYTDEFGVWWDTLTESEQDAIDVVVRLLEARGPQLGYPYSSNVLVSTLREVVEALGGELHLVAVFLDEGAVRIRYYDEAEAAR